MMMLMVIVLPSPPAAPSPNHLGFEPFFILKRVWRGPLASFVGRPTSVVLDQSCIRQTSIQYPSNEDLPGQRRIRLPRSTLYHQRRVSASRRRVSKHPATPPPRPAAD